MDNQSSNPDQQPDEQGAQPKPSPHQHGEGIGKEKEKTGSKQGGNEPQGGEHKSQGGQRR
jgi:hypothetical protein